MKLGVQRLTDTAILPSYAHAGDACFDLCIDSIEIKHQESLPACVIGTGLGFDIPVGFALMMYSRSGHGFKNGIRLANGTGVIDSGYKGELKIKLVADDTSGARLLNELKHGDRIAQAMLIPVPILDLVEVDWLGSSERGENGIGSSGM